uniref:Uncharacterized protein n=1 Tax=Globisporangium ultimum (strain ATCC 200006 / CBS 805.95 / DAOM BR144) TaxID=431595 RepID=K3X5R8_GLOUD
MADKGDAQQRETNPHVATFATTVVQLGAAALLGGGFYYGIAKQRRVEVEEKEKASLSSKNKKQSTQSSNVAAKDKVPVIREVTLLERQLGLHKPVTPSAAAWKALAGGTIVSVSGCLVLLFGMGAVLGVRNMTEFRERMEDVFPRMRKGVARALHIQPKEYKQDSASELAELRELAALFDEKVEEKPAKPENGA